MKLPNKIQYIEVYYDGRCGMCCTFHEWVNTQERNFEVRFAPYQAPEAEEWFPGVNKLEPEREMIVKTDEGILYRGAEGWVMCLMSCKKYVNWAERMTNPRLLPMAKKLCQTLAARRHTLSKMFFLKKDKEVARALHQMPDQEGCVDCETLYEDNQIDEIPDGVI